MKLLILGILFFGLSAAKAQSAHGEEFAKILAEYEKAQPVAFSEIKDKVYFGQCFKNTPGLSVQNSMFYGWTQSYGPIISQNYGGIIECLTDEEGFKRTFGESWELTIGQMKARTNENVNPGKIEEGILTTRYKDVPQTGVQYKMNSSGHLVATIRVLEDVKDFKAGHIEYACYFYINRNR